ncbi:hypothetical protein C8J57DRAFT_1222985 [Mycena rebaudengoi]|nr:hypothetical protein C8J57DRAFT_1222985 [Mycena rebaudengoi]
MGWELPCAVGEVLGAPSGCLNIKWELPCEVSCSYPTVLPNPQLHHKASAPQSDHTAPQPKQQANGSAASAPQSDRVALQPKQQANGSVVSTLQSDCAAPQPKQRANGSAVSALQSDRAAPQPKQQANSSVASALQSDRAAPQPKQRANSSAVHHNPTVLPCSPCSKPTVPQCVPLQPKQQSNQIPAHCPAAIQASMCDANSIANNYHAHPGDMGCTRCKIRIFWGKRTPDTPVWGWVLPFHAICAGSSQPNFSVPPSADGSSHLWEWWELPPTFTYIGRLPPRPLGYLNKVARSESRKLPAELLGQFRTEGIDGSQAGAEAKGAMGWRRREKCWDGDMCKQNNPFGVAVKAPSFRRRSGPERPMVGYAAIAVELCSPIKSKYRLQAVWPNRDTWTAMQQQAERGVCWIAKGGEGKRALAIVLVDLSYVAPLPFFAQCRTTDLIIDLICGNAWTTLPGPPSHFITALSPPAPVL